MELDFSEQISSAKKRGLWDNIRDKKKRMGKNYKPAKPGDKGRPDPKQWKKLTSDKICSTCGANMQSCKCNKANILDLEQDDNEPTEDNITPINE